MLPKLGHDSWQQWDGRYLLPWQSISLSLISCLEFRYPLIYFACAPWERIRCLRNEDCIRTICARQQSLKVSVFSGVGERICGSSARQNQRSQLINHRQFLSFLQINFLRIVSSLVVSLPKMNSTFLALTLERVRIHKLEDGSQLFWMISINVEVSIRDRREDDDEWKRRWRAIQITFESLFAISTTRSRHTWLRYVWGRAMPMGEEWRQIIKKKGKKSRMETVGDEAGMSWMNEDSYKICKLTFQSHNWASTWRLLLIFCATHEVASISPHQPVKKLLYMRLMDDKSTSWEFWIFITFARRLFVFSFQLSFLGVCKVLTDGSDGRFGWEWQESFIFILFAHIIFLLPRHSYKRQAHTNDDQIRINQKGSLCLSTSPTHNFLAKFVNSLCDKLQKTIQDMPKISTTNLTHLRHLWLCRCFVSLATLNQITNLHH